MRPTDPIFMREAAEILGCTKSTVARHVLAGTLPRHEDRYRHRALSRADVEQLASQIYDWRRHLVDDKSYWVTGRRAADVLGISTARVKQLAVEDRLPFVPHRDGTRLFRRAQLEVMARHPAFGERN